MKWHNRKTKQHGIIHVAKRIEGSVVRTFRVYPKPDSAYLMATIKTGDTATCADFGLPCSDVDTAKGWAELYVNDPKAFYGAGPW